MDTQITTALIGAVAVGGTIGGTVIGSWLQARGGRAQAAAARDAAATAARAAHDQAVRERVWTVVPLYLRAASAYVDAMERQLQTEDARADVRAAYRAFELAHAEAELAVPEEMRDALANLRGSMNGFRHVERQWGRSMRAWYALRELAAAGDAAAGRAVRMVPTQEMASRPDQPVIVRSVGPYEPGPVIAAVEAVTALTPRQRSTLNTALRRDPAERYARLERARNTHERARRAVIDGTRAALGTAAAPAAVPEQTTTEETRS
ncbi:hypothetical protein ADK90_28150 [Streptomyces sp. XY413]|uniref:hypothetical protein n=1 Tax=unclassified Streptomyces TaxID=2593676 RepID=UPI0006B05362|nr:MULTISPECIES: hypothetical protein [unclassified Streptomyces]KOU59198.1 hypothetical protein ADK96_33105 [Streptomyces sp. IGB124]KOV16386.1 hypothetical protein ADK90_28150 [Streptomyces sp. XY413]